MRLPFVPICMAALLATTPGHAQDRGRIYLDHMSVVAPADWTVETRDSQVVLTAPFRVDTLYDRCYIIIGAASQFNGGPIDLLATFDAIVPGNLERLVIPPIQSLSGGWLTTERVYRNRYVPSLFTQVIATARDGVGQVMQVGNNLSGCHAFTEPVVKTLQVNNNPKRQLPSGQPLVLAASRQQDDRRELSAARPSPSCATGGPGCAPSASSGRVVALWHGTKRISTATMQSNMFGAPSFGTETRLAQWSMLFLTDGRYLEVLPPDGIDEQTIARIPAVSRGRYQQQGATIVIQRDSGGPPERMEMRDNSIVSDAGTLDARRPDLDGARLDGVFTAQPNVQQWQSSGFRSEPTISFTPDGRFEDRGALHWVRRATRTGDDLTNRFGKGQYRFSGHNLTFQYEDGRLVRLTAMSTAPQSITLVGAMLMRRAP